MRLSTDKAGTVVGPEERIHPATHLGTDHDVLSPHAPDHRPAAMFGQAAAIMRGSVEKIDAQLECPLHRGDSRAVVPLRVEITKRRGSEPDSRDLKPGPAKPTARHGGHWNHVGGFFAGPLPGRADPSFFGFACH